MRMTEPSVSLAVIKYINCLHLIRRPGLLVLIMFYVTVAFGQSPDSLRQLLSAAGPAEKPGILCNFAAKIMEENPEQAVKYAAEAYELARASGNGAEEARALYLQAE